MASEEHWGGSGAGKRGDTQTEPHGLEAVLGTGEGNPMPLEEAQEKLWRSQGSPEVAPIPPEGP